MPTSEDLREIRMRERLKPWEALLAQGIINQEQFEAKKKEILKELGSVVCPACRASNPPTVELCFNCGAKLQEDSYLYEVIQRLEDEGFDIYENVTYDDYFFKFVAQNSKFKLTILGSVEAFFVFAEFSSIDIYSLREFSANCLEYAKEARSSSPFWRSLICFPVAIVDSTDRATLEYIRNKAPPRHVGLVEMPVVYDLNSSMLYYFEKSPVWGYGYLRKAIQRLLAQ